jgi:hypothetical protein
MVEHLKSLRREDYASTEEYEKALADATKFYKDQEAYYINEYNKVVGRSKEVYEEDYLAYDGWSKQTITSSDNLVS